MARKSEPEYYIGIDNGNTGTIGITDKDGSPIMFEKTPVHTVNGVHRLDHDKFKEILSRYRGKSIALIERPMLNPKRWKASISATRCDESMKVILEQLGIPYEQIDSRQWQHQLFTGVYEHLTTKQASIDLGNQTFPEYKQHKHTDRDGILIAFFGATHPEFFERRNKKTQKRKKPKK